MGFLDFFFQGKTKERYMQQGFTEAEAAAMSWICRQKAAGKFYGASTGLFLALTWGHLHEKLIRYIPFTFNRKLTQLGIIMASILASDYLFTGRRRGANELFANQFYWNNNLFLANIDSLIENFDIFTRKFTPQQTEVFNFRKNLIRTHHQDLTKKKWIYNPLVYTPAEFQARIQAATKAPWTMIELYNPKYGKGSLSAPVNIGKLIDQTGDKLGITQYYVHGWAPIH